MKYLLIISVIVFSILGCKNKPKEVVDQVSTSNGAVKSTTKIEDVEKIDPCVRCDSIYNDFPKDSASFEKLFGYPNGSRYDGHEEISELFGCLEGCYEYDELVSVIRLQSNLAYNADATSHIRHGTSRFIMEHKDEGKKALEELSCFEFSKFIYFSFDRISKVNSFYSEQCDFLLELDLQEACKAEVMHNYCVLKNVETDKH